ncbi:MAG: type II toxin-antitoxin system HicA family toxin [Acidobacteriia bacterium]|nr:type II toxin-antitoxin system HicA family toxin [Terriglobia bacterium]
MRLPRDLSGHELIRLLRRYGYEPTRQVGSHIRLQSSLRGHTHHLTVPDHHSLRLGTLSAILSDVADYLGLERSKVELELFGK